MESEAEYTDDGNYLSKVTASDGSSTSYDYDELKGTLDSVTEPGDASVSYLNDNRKLKEIVSPSGTSYLFFYNTFNQRTETSIGYRELATYTYDELGRLVETYYGNCNNIETYYDTLSRVSFISYYGQKW